MLNPYKLTDDINLVPVELPETREGKLVKMFGTHMVIHDQGRGLLEGHITQINSNGKYQLSMETSERNNPHTNPEIIEVNLDVQYLLGAYQRRPITP